VVPTKPLASGNQAQNIIKNKRIDFVPHRLLGIFILLRSNFTSQLIRNEGGSLPYEYRVGSLLEPTGSLNVWLQLRRT